MMMMRMMIIKTSQAAKGVCFTHLCHTVDSNQRWSKPTFRTVCDSDGEGKISIRKKMIA